MQQWMMTEQEAKAFQDDGGDGSQGHSALLSISLLRQALAKCQAPGTLHLMSPCSLPNNHVQAFAFRPQILMFTYSDFCWG